MVDCNINKIFDWKNLKNELIKLRHYFHKNPELGFKEYQTSNTIFEYLDDLGLKIEKEVSSKIGRTIQISFIHDGTAAADAYAETDSSVLLTFGTAIGVGFPIKKSDLRPVSDDLL